MKRFLFIFVLTIFLISGGLAHAQSTDPLGIPEFQNEIFLSLIPQYPAPNQEIDIRAENNLLDMDRSMYRWERNGVVIAEGIGRSRISIQTGNAGERTTINVIVEDPGGEVGTGSISFTPAVVDLVWEAQTYTPPFYRGKALNTSESSIVLQAIPYFRNSAGGIISPSSIIFEWSTEKGLDQQASGIGRDSYTINSDRVSRSRVITVTAKTFDETQQAQARTSFVIESPEVYVYEQHPLQGLMLNRAIRDTSLSEDQDEITLSAVPYFFSTSAPNNPAMQYAWTVDRRGVSNNTPSITLRKEGLRGVSDISVSVERLERYFQKAMADLTITF